MEKVAGMFSTVPTGGTQLSEKGTPTLRKLTQQKQQILLSVMTGS